MEALLKLRNLSVSIRCGNELLSSVEDISFDIMPGEILGIVGESGAGKSITTLSIPGLLDENKLVTGGSIFFSKANDNLAEESLYLDLLTLSEKELEAIRGKEISFVFQEPSSSLNPLMKAGAQIAETLEIHGEKNRATAMGRAKELMEKLRLPEPEKLAGAYPHRLSGGMCQRVMIALALICRPRLLIADEPTTALDVNTQSQIINLLKEINRDTGTSILFISHDLEVIKSVCSRVLVMYSGRILEEGITSEVFSRPAHEYTRGLINSIPNRANRGKDLTAIPGKTPSLEEGRSKGCPFHPRCGKASTRCKEEFPAARPASIGHTTRCLLQEAR
jgi:peptide/nickel transport system ATP-binding protein